MSVRRVAIVGPGRAGGSLAGALGTIGWEVALVGRDGDIRRSSAGRDLVVLAVPDASVATVATAVAPDQGAVVAHVSGSLGLAPLSGHPRAAVLHPLVSLPDAEVGARRLREGAWFGLAADGDPLATEVVAQLGGRAITVDEPDWVRYHAAAVIAANHVVGLLGQVERIAASIGAPLAAYLDLAAGAVANTAELGPAAALTGPVRRGDWATVDRHLAALPPGERAGYEAGVDLCRQLLDR